VFAVKQGILKLSPSKSSKSISIGTRESSEIL